MTASPPIPPPFHHPSHLYPPYPPTSPGLDITFTESAKFFQTTVPNVNPRFILQGIPPCLSHTMSQHAFAPIHTYSQYDTPPLFPDIRLVPQLILLKENLLSSINRRLLSANIQIPYFATVSKSFSIELGILYSSAFISTLLSGHTHTLSLSLSLSLSLTHLAQITYILSQAVLKRISTSPSATMTLTG